MARRITITIAAAVLIAGMVAAKKKNPDDFTQTLAMPKDPPSVAIGETRRLTFQVSPLSGRGLLSQQTRDALKAILKDNGGVPVVHLRAFVAGSGDVRRVPQIVSEVFTERKLPLPSVSVVLSGGLPLENAQVVLEATSAGKRDVNTGGLEFVPGVEVSGGDPGGATDLLLAKTLNELKGLTAANAVQVSCFVSALYNAPSLIGAIHARFPGAVISLVQTQRSPSRALARCEGIARGGSVQVDRLAFSGTRVAFGVQEKDAALAFQRLDRDLNDSGASAAGIVFSNVYSLSSSVAGLVKKLRSVSDALAVIPFEGAASVDAGFAVDAVAPVSK